MSNGLAIAAVTATLRSLLSDKLGLPDVTARSPDKARDGIAGDQVNLFLYHIQVEPAWRNSDMPRQNKPGETGFPPLPLNLFYLVTALSDEKDEVKNHSLLGRAMRVLHDHPLLDASEIKDATQANVPGADLHEQIERVRITLQPLPVEEISKLWTAFQTNFRTSAGYQVSVVLIESERPVKAPLPVLTRGKDDTGVGSQADVTSPFPTLLEIVLPPGQASARLGDVVTLKGLHLDAGTPEVRLSHSLLPAPGPVTIEASSATEIRIKLKDDPTAWVPGFYNVAVVMTSGDDVRFTNELSLTVAPRITTVLPLDVVRQPDKSAEIPLGFSPRVRPGQRVALLIGGAPAEPLPALTVPVDTLNFVVKNAPVGTHFLRLRVDGVDSLLVQSPAGQPPVFDPSQRVKIQ